ncbi:uncharacterized protein LOC127881600 [Dreissena polymorpha]|nr:uncharacterized protein LOC127881600 [Dreissena polymorpha]
MATSQQFRDNDSETDEDSSSGKRSLIVVQIGNNNNTVVTCDKIEPRFEGSGRDQRAIHQSKNLAGIHVMKTILSNHGRPMPRKALEQEAYQLAKKKGFRSFHELAGWSVNDFLDYNKSLFKITSRKKEKYVKLKENIFVTPTNDEHDDETDAVPTSIQSDNFSTITNCVASQSLSKEGIDEIMKQENNIQEQSLKKLPMEFDHGEFYQIVSGGISSKTLFVESIDKYESDPLRFSVDIVSMWNTPHRIKSHIIFGVTHDKKLIGVEKNVDHDFFETIFCSSYFTMPPSFKLYKTNMESKLFYVIEIASSRGQGVPSIVKCDQRSRNVNITKNQLWIRTDVSNEVCEPSSLKSGIIYDWFLNTTLSSGSSQSRMSPLPSLNIPVTVNKRLCTTGTQSMFDTQTESDQTDDGDTVTSGTTFDFFCGTVDGFKRGHFVLVTGDVSCLAKDINAFGLVPWLCVYDFDIFSSTNGLFNAVEDTMKTRRHLKVYTWNDTPEPVSEKGTKWCFLRGRREISCSRTDLNDDEIETSNLWFKQVKRGVEGYCERLSNFVENYTVLTVVLLWPQNEKLLPYMTKFVGRLNDALSCTPAVVVCTNENHAMTEKGRTRLKALCEDFGDNIKVCDVGFEQLCTELKTYLQTETVVTTYSLPCNIEVDNSNQFVEINETDATWLSEDFEVLYLKPTKSSVLNEQEIHDEITRFYKGGTLPWYAWYKNEAQSAVVERNVQKELEHKLQKHLEDYRTSTVTLFHAPGAGGTTLAQKILWKFHETYPCVHLKLRTSNPIEELDRKITFISEKTGKVVLMLVDAEEESKIRFLSKRLKYTVILYVKRYPYRFQVPPSMEQDRVFLTGNVTLSESQELALKLGEKCEDDVKRLRLNQLTKGVKEGSGHCMYEYGMTVYLHEFKGIVSYVSGYLQLDKNSTSELTPCQTCLGYLALVYYYGQSSVPCQFFARLFNRPSNIIMDLEDFPMPIQEFVVYDKNESRRNYLRICHYIVAKEILEQILSRNNQGCLTLERTDSLGQNACRALSAFCSEFISYTGKKNVKMSSTVRMILTKTFIYRDERDMGDNEEQVRRKPVLSKVMIDIPAGKPLFTERLKVLQKLVETFPEEPNFHAHLGRFYAFCRPDEEHNAELCFQKAVFLCDEQNAGKTTDQIDDGMKLTMMHIYHMYGIVKQRYIAKFTGRSPKDKVVAFKLEDIFLERLSEIVPCAEEACDYFALSRNYTPESHDLYTYAYTAEIQVRLQICDFVSRQYNAFGDNRWQQFFSTTTNQRAKQFVQRSISVIEALFLECYMSVELLSNDFGSLRKSVIWYNTLFRTHAFALEDMQCDNTMSNRRLKIAAKKLKCGKPSVLNGIEMIDNADDIEEVIALYEANFSDIERNGNLDGREKKELEIDFKEWIYAIRQEVFPSDYTLENVLTHLNIWYQHIRSPLSVYYVFIVYSLLGFGTDRTPGKTECLIEALEIRETLKKMSHLIIRPKYPREWLGETGEGIKRLKFNERYVGICAEDRDFPPTSRLDLAVCKGTITRPNTNNVNGIISLDLKVRTKDIDVYFIPKKAKLEGSRFAGQRVEFHLAFTINHGYEAYNVKLLKRHACPGCSRNIEFTSADVVITCKCGKDVYKDDLNVSL